MTQRLSLHILYYDENIKVLKEQCFPQHYQFGHLIKFYLEQVFGSPINKVQYTHVFLF